MANLRRMSRAQADRDIVKKQSGFLGGMNLDSHPFALEQGEVSLLDNLVAFRGELRTRKGYSELYASTGWVGTAYSLIYHKIRKKFYLHQGDSLYESTDGSAFSLVGTGLQEADSKLVPFEKELLIMQDGYSYITELEYSGTLRRFDGENPSGPPALQDRGDTGPTGTGDYVYRYILTFARVVDGIVVGESGPVSPTDTDPDYVEIYSPDPIVSESTAPYLDKTLMPRPTQPDTPWTHIRIYRTLNIGAGIEERYSTSTNQVSGANVNNPEDYYLEQQMSFTDLDSYVQTGIGVMAVGSSFVVSSPDTYAGFLDTYAEPLKGRFLVPVDPVTTAIYLRGFLLWGDVDTIRYTETASPLKHSHLHNPATQFYTVEDTITALREGPDTVTIFCEGSTYRQNIYTARDTAAENSAETTYVLEPATEIDSHIGVVLTDSICQIGQAQYIAVCSDRSVRIWDSRAWGVDWAERTISSEIAKIQSVSASAYHTDGEYLLWYNDGTTNKTLRLGTREEVGTGWSFFSGTNWIQPETIAPIVLGSNKSYSSIAIVNQTVYVVGDAYDDDGNVFPTQVVTGQWFGQSPSYHVIHRESDIFLKEYGGTDLSTLDYTVTVKSESQEVSDVFSGLPPGNAAPFLRSLAKVEGSYVQLDIQTTSPAYRLVHIVSRLRTQDKQYNIVNQPEIAPEEFFNGGLTSWHIDNGVGVTNRVSPTREYLETIPVTGPYTHLSAWTDYIFTANILNGCAVAFILWDSNPNPFTNILTIDGTATVVTEPAAEFLVNGFGPLIVKHGPGDTLYTWDCSTMSWYNTLAPVTAGELRVNIMVGMSEAAADFRTMNNKEITDELVKFYIYDMLEGGTKLLPPRR